MSILKNTLILALPLIVACNVINDSPIEKSTILNQKDNEILKKEYSGFKTLALTQSYLEAKVRKLVTLTDDTALLKEIEYARVNHPTLLKTIMCGDSNLFAQATAPSKTKVNVRINTVPTFANYINQLRCLPSPTATPTSSPTPFRPVTLNKIIFSSGGYLATMNTDGSGFTKINNEVGTRPSWSYSGNKIAYNKSTGSDDDIYTMNSDGSNITALTNNAVYDHSPSWSPDGTKITYCSARNSNYEIFIMNSDGSNQVQITSNTANDYYPMWSPDGNKILFYSNMDGDFEIYTINTNGSNLTQLTFNSTEDSYAKWSHDGTKIVFVSKRDGNSGEIYKMNADGSNQTRITNNTINDYYPSWSPDGTKIVYSSVVSNYEIYIMNEDGSNKTRLTNNVGHDEFAEWR